MRGSCVVIDPNTAAQECTVTLLLTGRGQISLVGPSYNPALRSTFRLGIAAGAGIYKTARGQVRLDFGTNGDIDLTVRLVR